MAEFQIPASKSRIKSFVRVELEPRDFDETAKFYRRLGFQVTIKGDSVGARSAELKAGDVRVRFTEAGAGGHDRRRSAFHRVLICFGVTRADEVRAELAGKGIAFEERGPKAVEVTDPNGVRILLEESA